ncbi:hypothetical protein [Citrobacter freundii]|uniref:hypothetical protein n=1 Tax=Citrobacter freundii TaxID=546 RepID=UPI00300C87AF
MITEKNNVFYCDCGFSWRRGMSGSHNCEDRLRAKLTDMAVQLANAESKCRELAAENAHARERHIFIRALAVSILEHSGGRMDWRGAMEDATELLQTVDSVYAKTPATDAFLAEVRAQGVEMFAIQQRQIATEQEQAGDYEFSRHCIISADEACEFAEELREVKCCEVQS